MTTHILRANPTAEDDSWVFTVPPHVIQPKGKQNGKFIQFTHKEITLRRDQLPSNRVVHNDDPSKFVLLSFAGFRFPDTRLRVTSDYISRLLKAGLFINNVQYRFYHHSNSQLVRISALQYFISLMDGLAQRGRSCFLRAASSDEELDAIIYQMGDFGRIMNVAKREELNLC
jgi:hypothetical protein